jgi:type VI secretion system protein ImpJ
MSWNNRVVWSEGMFLRQQHLQQHVRHMEAHVERRAGGLRSHSWGFQELQLDAQALTLGKLSIAGARGVLPDGTPFSVPDDDEPPAPLEVAENTRGAVAFLALPIRRPGTAEVASRKEAAELARYFPAEDEVRDSNRGAESVAQVLVGKLRLRLMLDTERRDEYACVPLARVVECRTDRNLVLDDGFLPSVLDVQASRGLAGYVKELLGLLHHRGEALAARVSVSGRGGAAEIADFLMLQTVNRYQPLVGHLAELRGLHPEDLYRSLLLLAGELATFTGQGRRAQPFPPYRHDDLQASFAPVVTALRQSLSMVLEQNAIAIPLEERKYGIRVGVLADRSLLGKASFVLAVSASVPAEDLRRRFPTQVKIGAVEQIRQLVNVQLPGIAVRALPVAPRQIPYHAGLVYFELDRASEHWQYLQQSGGFALHVGGEFPGLQMEFWAIRE